VKNKRKTLKEDFLTVLGWGKQYYHPENEKKKGLSQKQSRPPGPPRGGKVNSVIIKISPLEHARSGVEGGKLLKITVHGF